MTKSAAKVIKVQTPKRMHEAQVLGVDFFLGRDGPPDLRPLGLASARASGPWDSRVRLFSMPTGAGKTGVLKVAAYRARELGVTGVLVVVPQLDIASSLVAEERWDYAGDIVDIPRDTWLLAKDGDQAKNFDMGKNHVMTHSRAVKWYKEKFIAGADLSGKLLIIDEAHHSGETGEADPGTRLFEFAKAWFDKGGTVWMTTATPYRRDDLNLLPENSAVCTIRYTELAARQVLPRKIRLSILSMGDTKPDLDMVARYVVEQGRPAVIRLQPNRTNSVTAKDVGDACVAAFAQVNASWRVENTIGDDDNQSGRLRDILDEERAAAVGGGWSKRKVDSFVVCARMLEGSDWAYCGHAVLVGVPTSRGTVIQLAGRGFRNKKRIKGYPSAWADEVLVSLIVPNLDAEEESARRDHLKRLAEIVCHLEDSEVAVSYASLWIKLVANCRLPPYTRQRGSSGPASNGPVPNNAADLSMNLQSRIDRARESLTVNGFRAYVDQVVSTIEDPDERLQAKVYLLTGAVQEVDDEIAALPAKLVPALETAFETTLKTAMDGVEAWAKSSEEIASLMHEAYDNLLDKALDEIVARHGDLLVTRPSKLLSGLSAVIGHEGVKDLVESMRAARDGAFNLPMEAGAGEASIYRLYDDMAKASPKNTVAFLTERDRVGFTRDLSQFVGFTYDTREIAASLERRWKMSIGQLDKLFVRRVLGPSRRGLTVDELRNNKALVAKVKRLDQLGRRVDITASRVSWRTDTDIDKILKDPQYQVGNVLGAQKHEENLLFLDLCCRNGWRGLPGGVGLHELLLG